MDSLQILSKFGIKSWLRWANLSSCCLVFCVGCAQLHTTSATSLKVADTPSVRQQTDQGTGNALRDVVRGQLPEIAEEEPKMLPISLETVFRLAQNQNGEVLLAREKLTEAFAGKEVADKAWLPDIYVGASYYRHEGGIQDQTGQFIHSSFGSLFGGVELNGKLDLREATFKKVDAERKIWQQRGEVTRMTSENLLDASQTYIDLLTAKSGEAIAREAESKLRELLEDTEKLAKAEPALQVEVARIRSNLAAQQQITRKVREGVRSATAKLNHLLGLDPTAELVVMERNLAPFHLIDPRNDPRLLIQKALSQGPGVQDMEGLLNLIADSQARSQSLTAWMPILEMRMAEGGFGAGPGASMKWDNRWDMALQARWNLTSGLTSDAHRRMGYSKMHQANLGYQNLRSKLALGVQEAWESNTSNNDQLQIAQEEIKQSQETYKLSKYRWNQRLKGSSPSEVLLAIRTYSAAQLAYLNAVRGYDKAQIRLWVLTGMGTAANCQPSHLP